MSPLRLTNGCFFSLCIRCGTSLTDQLKWEATRRLFPFDGKCDASRDADFTVTFKEGKSLKANSRHLQEASQVLRNLIEDCKHTRTLAAADDSREAWLVLLNLVHPARRIAGPDRSESHDLPTMEVYAQLALKYGVSCMHHYVDSGLCQAVEEAKARVPLHLNPNQAVHYFAENSFLCRCSRVAAKFRLEMAKEANASHFELLLRRMKPNSGKPDPDGYTAGTLISRHVALLSSTGDYQFASMIAEKAMQVLRL